MSETLYYDGKCPLCSKEINLLRRLKGDQLALQDVHATEAVNTDAMPDKSEMLRVLHLQTATGEWLKGLDANVAAWRHTSFGWLFAVLRWPIVKPIADRVYNRWADRRFCNLGY